MSGLNLEKLQQKVKGLFILDLRSLALLRVGLGSVVILDLIQRFPFIEAFYSDRGFFPHTFYSNYTAKSSLALSFHSFGTSTDFFTILFFLEAIFALFLILGWHTRIFTILSWIFLTSLDNRNSLILNNGDLELRLLLFWGIFLPLGGKFSLDSFRKVSRAGQYTGLPSAAYYTQFFLIYFFAGIHKIISPVWQQGNGVLSALSMETLATPFAVFLRSYPDLLRPANFAVVLIELAAPLILILSPTYKKKLFAIGLLIFMHFWFSLSFSLGLFPLVGIIGLSGLLPGEFWNLKFMKNIAGYLHIRDGGTNSSAIPEVRLKNTRNLLLILLILTIFWVNLWSVKLTGGLFPQIISFSRYFQIYQSWGMFSSFPNDDRGYYSVQGKLENGGIVNLADNQPWERFTTPTPNASYFANSRWSNVFLHYFKNPWHSTHFAEYLCNKYRAENITQISDIEIAYIIDNKTAKIANLKCSP